MSQSQQATAPPPTQQAEAALLVAPPTGAEVQQATQAKPAEGARSTPQRLRLLAVATLVACILFAAVGAWTFISLSTALGRAQDNAEQLIRVQQIEANLLQADATATNAFLVGGLEPPEQRATYDKALADTSKLIAEASEAQPADRDALAALNGTIVDYAAAIEQARANNRQGFPVGAQYLKEASADLRQVAIPISENLVTANQTRADAEMDSRTIPYFEIFGALVVIGLVLIMIWVARRFKRTINVGLLISGVLILVSLVGGAIALNSVSGAVREVNTGPFSSLEAGAAARIAANNAKSNESLTLIARGSGAGFEKSWVSSDESVQDALAAITDESGASEQLSSLWGTYETTHQEIRKLDDGGGWDDAVQIAVGTGDDSSNVTFGAFDAEAASFIQTVSAETAGGLGGPRTGLIIGGIIIFAAGVVAAAFGWQGLSVRLREYR